MILCVPVIPLFSDLLRLAKINGFLQYITEVSVWPANKWNRKEMVPLLAPIHHSLQHPPKKKCFFRFVLVPRPSQSSAISPKRMLGPGHEASLYISLWFRLRPDDRDQRLPIAVLHIINTQRHLCLVETSDYCHDDDRH